MHYEGPRPDGRRPRQGGPWQGAQEDLGRTTVPEGFRDPDRFGRMRPTVNPYAGRIENNPILPGRSTPGANIGGGWNLYEGGPEPTRGMEWLLNQDQQAPMSSSGSYLSSRYGGGLDDAAGMNDGARGMIEDAGFEIAQSPGMTDKRTFKELWRQSVNKFAPGTPDRTIKKEWNRLKDIFMKKKYGFKPPGALGIGMDLGLDFLESEQGQELFEQFDPNRGPIIT